jgi:hypothetical protein
MPVNKSFDLRLANGSWKPVDVLGDAEEGVLVYTVLERQGWEKFFSVGNSDGELMLQSWRRMYADKPAEYLLEVCDASDVAPYMLVPSFPELMDLFARWAPVVQAASVSTLIHDLTEPVLDAGGVVEAVRGSPTARKKGCPSWSKKLRAGEPRANGANRRWLRTGVGSISSTDLRNASTFTWPRWRRSDRAAVHCGWN